MITKKDYERAAAIVRETRLQYAELLAVEAIERAFIVFFREDNPRFDAMRFRIACEIAKPIARKRTG